MAEVILTADRLTQAEAKKVSKDLIGETAPNFTLLDDAGNVFESSTLDGLANCLLLCQGRFSNMQAWMSNLQGTT